MSKNEVCVGRFPAITVVPQVGNLDFSNKQGYREEHGEMVRKFSEFLERWNRGNPRWKLAVSEDSYRVE